MCSSTIPKLPSTPPAMSDPQPEVGSSRDKVNRSSSSRHTSRSERETRDRPRDHRSHSHRDHRDKDSRSSRHRDHERPRSRSPHRHRSSRDAEGQSSSRSTRSRDEDKHRRRHRDDSHRSSRRDEPHRSDRHSHSSSRRSRDHTESSAHRRRSPSESRSPSRSPPRRSEPLDSARSATSPSAQRIETEAEQDVDDDAPNFAPSGLLAAESNMLNGVALKYHEPPEARKPKTRWRLYCFKDNKEQQLLHLGSQSAYLLGRDRNVVDIPLDHESCSKQHAVVQFRQIITTNEFGDKKKRIHPFLIDLESSNGSYVNDTEIPTSRYYQLRTGDTLTFGASTREYVLLDESAA